MLYFILILIIIVLTTLLLLFKGQVKSISRQLESRSKEGSQKYIDIALFDKDLTELAVQINKSIERERHLSINVLKANRELKDSVANISHDLRTPLTSIIGYLQLLNKHLLDPTGQSYVEIVFKKAEILRGLIDEFFELSILEGNDNIPVLQRTNLTNAVTECILDNLTAFEEKNIVPHFESSHEPVFILADQDMLRRVLQNLLMNCIKYSNGDVTIYIIMEEDVQLIIKNPLDNPQEIDASILFNRFYTGDKARSSSGTGLGLSIVKLLTEKMNGSVKAGLENDILEIQISFKGI